MLKKLSISFYCLFLLTACEYLFTQKSKNQAHSAEQQATIHFSDLSQWQERKFAGSTEYTTIKKNHSTILKATTSDSASMLYQAINIDLNKTPYLSWQWKISNTYPKNINEHNRNGDDYPARIYIAIKNKNGNIYPRALIYVWSSYSPQFTHWKNPYSQSITMLSIESGDALAGQWITEKRNLKQDLKTYFGEEIDAIEGIAIMSDSDNTDSQATTYYQKISFTKN